MPKGSSPLPPVRGRPRWSPRPSAIRATRAWSPTRGNIGAKPPLQGMAGHWSSSMTRDAPCSARGNPSFPPSSGPRSSSSGNAAARRPASSPASTGTAPVNKSFLSGILRCSKCHRGLVGHRYRRKSGKVVHNYVCPSSDRGGCGGIAIRNFGRAVGFTLSVAVCARGGGR